MKTKRLKEIIANSSPIFMPAHRVPVVYGAKRGTLDETEDLFSVSSYTLNYVQDEKNEENKIYFPGNIAPEGYFYSPFYEVTLKELEDDLSSVSCRRINFSPSAASVISSSVTFYKAESGVFKDENLNVITITSPISYDFIIGQPFAIYDVMNDRTYRGYLDGFSGNTDGTCKLKITTDAQIKDTLLDGRSASGKSGYIISLMEENAPVYAEFIPSTQRLVWRGPKKMTDLTSDSPIYNMPFTNGRLYIHKNFNIFVRRQDPHGDYKLFRPSINNPLHRFQVEGNPKLDFDYVQEIIDSMVNAC